MVILNSSSLIPLLLLTYPKFNQTPPSSTFLSFLSLSLYYGFGSIINNITLGVGFLASVIICKLSTDISTTICESSDNSVPALPSPPSSSLIPWRLYWHPLCNNPIPWPILTLGGGGYCRIFALLSHSKFWQSWQNLQNSLSGPYCSFLLDTHNHLLLPPWINLHSFYIPMQCTTKPD